ncbi:hypothetical protein DAI22_02g058800 [Oryza sativa Japonica Group]|nr:hypothetical protein DAI22_02g058800 [Oryza sativa Japonica Group]
MKRIEESLLHICMSLASVVIKQKEKIYAGLELFSTGNSCVPNKL